MLVMQAVDVNEGITPSVIAKDFNLSQPTMTTILDRLEKKGYVERERCPADRRKILLHLNASGKAILSESSAALQDKFVSAFDGLEDWERSMLVASLQRIVNIMGADELDATPVLEWGQLSRNVEQADQ